MEREVDLMTLSEAGIHEIKKYMPNTEVFLETAISMLDAAPTSEESHFCILRTDLCHFKAVNDIDGYEAGDRVIVAFYKAVQNALAPLNRQVALGRAGGDEFTILIIGTEQEFECVAQGIVDQIAAIDFMKMGIHKQIHLYVGGLIAKMKEADKLRSIIDETHETLLKAKRLGEDSIYLAQY